MEGKNDSFRKDILQKFRAEDNAMGTARGKHGTKKKGGGTVFMGERMKPPSFCGHTHTHTHPFPKKKIKQTKKPREKKRVCVIFLELQRFYLLCSHYLVFAVLKKKIIKKKNNF